MTMENATLMMITALTLLGLAGCSSTQALGAAPYTTAYSGPTYVQGTGERTATVAALGLQACANHASNAQKTYADDFRVLRFDTERLVNLPVSTFVGSQPVARVLDGEGARYGRDEYRLVSFHCLQDTAGQVVYSFVRGQ
jgi:outer membrane lipoprotein SlyB